MKTGLKSGITHLRLTNFRSYGALDMTLDAAFGPVILTGPNGAGKTNVLEAVSFLTPGRGLRAARLSEVARHDGIAPPDVASLPLRWSVSAQVQTPRGGMQIGTGTVDGSERRQVKIDGKPIAKQAELGEVVRCLWLTPAQDRLFCGDPLARRRFLDRLVQAFDAAHANRLTDYHQALKQWSCLLREGGADNRWLDSLERALVENGVAIGACRLDVVSRVSAQLEKQTHPLFPAAEISLTGLIEQELLRQPAIRVEELFADLLKKSRKSYAEGGSLAGPHTADFRVVHTQKNQEAGVCSTGEQKALLLAIILAEGRAQMMEQGLCPLLLLDEVGAHLDARRRDALFEILEDYPAQIWMTGTDENAFMSLARRAVFFDVNTSALNFRKVA